MYFYVCVADPKRKALDTNTMRSAGLLVRSKRLLCPFPSRQISSAYSRLVDILSEKDGVRNATKFYDSEVHPVIRSALSAASAVKDAPQSSPGVLACLDSVFGSTSSDEFVLLMMKALCDAKRLEDVRLLFAIAIRETAVPSTELFTVLLLGISWSDTFTEHEVDNIWSIMEERGVPRDAVTDLCFLHLFLRLQRRDFLASHWEGIKGKCQQVISAYVKDTRKNPLPVGFASKLSHCFVTALRVSPDSNVVWDMFDTIVPLTIGVLENRRTTATQQQQHSDPQQLRATAPDESLLAAESVLTTKNVITFLTASLINAATTSQQLRRLFVVLKQVYEWEYGQYHQQRMQVDSEPTPAPHMSSDKSPSVSTSEAPTGKTSLGGEEGGVEAAPPKSSWRASMFASANCVSDMNVCRMMARCVRDGDVEFARLLLQHVEAYPLKSPDVRSQFYFAYINVLSTELSKTEASDAVRLLLSELFDVLEDHCADEHCTVAALSLVTRVAVPLSSSVESSASSTNSRDVVQQILSPRPAADVIREALLLPQCASVELLTQTLMSQRLDKGKSVTSRSLHRILDSIVYSTHENDDVLAEVAKRFVETMSSVFRVDATLDTFELLAVAEARRDSVEGVESLLSLLSQRGVKPSYAILRSAMMQSTRLGDTSAALRLITLHTEYAIALDRNLAAVLLRQLCHLVDGAGVRKVLHAWRALHGTVDPRVVRMCEGVFRRWNLPSDDLGAFGQQS